jgi:membrane dipeptidase
MTTSRARAARLVATFGATALLATGCVRGGGTSAAVPAVGAVPPGDSPSVRVARLLAATPLVDGHSDLLRHWIECDGCPRDFAAYDIGRRTAGDADIPRMRAGRLGAQLLNVFGPEYTARSTRDGFDLVRRLPERYPADLAIAATADEARRIHASGRIAIVPTIEYAVRLENSPDVLREFHRRGLRAVTLAYRTNELADGADDAPRHGGLSALGRTMVAEMNRLGVLVDLSHVSDSTMHDVLDVAAAPVIFTHSSARALARVSRNVPDDVLRRLPRNGGVVMVSFVPYFTTQAFADWYAAGEAHWMELGRRHGADRAAQRREMAVWDSTHPPPTVTVADVADHVEHVRRVAGVDHVGIGSDFDGIDFKVRGLEDAATFPALFAELARRGWTDDELRKLAGENFLRAWERADAAARQPRRGAP